MIDAALSMDNAEAERFDTSLSFEGCNRDYPVQFELPGKCFRVSYQNFLHSDMKIKF
jgi:hypothetical protein